MTSIKTHKDLKVWKDAVKFVTEIYRISSQFPKSELYGITSQMRRAGVSVPANIAEGFGRNTTGELKQFLGIARGSLAELETLFEIAYNLNYIDDKVKKEATDTMNKLFRMIGALIKSLNK